VAEIIDLHRSARPPRERASAIDQVDRKVVRIRQEKTSPLIRAAVGYVHAVTAYEAGFMVDSTQDWQVAGAGGALGAKQIRKAKRSLRELASMCRSDGYQSSVEMKAKAQVVGFIMGKLTDGERDLDLNQSDFIRAFAAEIEYLYDAAYRLEWTKNRT